MKQTTKAYQNFKESINQEISDFPIFWAFSNEQFNEGLIKLNTTKENVRGIGGGGFIRKEDTKKFIDLMKEQNKTERQFLKEDKNLYQAFLYELANHEFCITYDYDETLNALGLKYDKLTKKQLSILEKAKKEYLSRIEDY